MANPLIDIAALTEEQQSALQQFTAVTNQELDAALPILQRCEWNVQIAIARLYDGEPTEPAEFVPPPQDTRRQETLLNSIPEASRSRDGGYEAAPRVVAQPESQVTYQAPFLLQLAVLPFNIIYGILSKTFGMFGYLFPFLPRLLGRLSGTAGTTARRRDTSGRRPLQPRDTAARFIRELEEEYGLNELPFFEGGYAQAYDAAKKELKFLLILLLSPEHDDTASYVRDTLNSPQVINFVKDPQNNIIIWAGNVQDPEAYQVSSELNCTKFPFAGLIVHTPSVSSTSMSTVARITGPTSPSTFVSKLQTAISQNSEPLNRARAQRAEQQAARDLREAQNSAYERSLAQDRERARLKREAEEVQRRAEREAQEKAAAQARYAKDLEQWKSWRAQSIKPEPGSGVSDIVRVSLRMPDGERIVRKFESSSSIEELYAFVECYEQLNMDKSGAGNATKPESFEHEYKFQLVSPMPREVYNLEAGGTVKERLGRSANLIVEMMVDEDEDEDEDEESEDEE